MIKENVKWSVCMLVNLLDMRRSSMSKTENDTWYKEYIMPDNSKIVVRISSHTINFDAWVEKEREEGIIPSGRISIVFRDNDGTNTLVIHDPRNDVFRVHEYIYDMRNDVTHLSDMQVHQIADAVKAISSTGKYEDPINMAEHSQIIL